MPYKRLSKDPTHSLNAICPYYTMFPLEFPLKIIKKMRNRTRILDPFCGRGTSIYAARAMGVESWGIDSSPVAVAIAQAKLSRASIEDALCLAEKILTEEENNCLPEGEFWTRAFHPKVLEDICRLRAGLLHRRSDTAALLRALCIGCLHGPLVKDKKNPSYFSNQMPRTFAPKLDYSVRFWKQKKLRPPRLSVLQVLTKKASRIQLEKLPQIGCHRNIIKGDSQRASTFSKLPDTFDLVITSPPFLGMRMYVADQWLRNWFLGGAEAPYGDKPQQLSHRDETSFINSLKKVWNNVGDLANQRMDLFIRFGSIPSYEVNSLEVLRRSLTLSRHEWRIISTRRASTADQGKRQADQMNVESESLTEYDVHVVLS
jgi:hypothetical protein